MARRPRSAPSRSQTGWRAVALAGFLLAGSSALAAPDASDKAGIWSIAVDNTHRQCRVNLRSDPTGTGWAMSMPPACRHAVPALAEVQGWSMPGDGVVSLDDANGQTVVLFDQHTDQGLHATDRQGEGLSLMPVKLAAALGAQDGADQGSIVTLQPAGAAQPDTLGAAPAAMQVAARAAVPVRSDDVAGHYAVMRGDRDTGCMVTLEAKDKGPKNTLRARLAPACRDQGIIIFDPLGWQVQAGHLVLTARKGHTIELDRSDNGMWVKEPKDFKALGLKPL